MDVKRAADLYTQGWNLRPISAELGLGDHSRSAMSGRDHHALVRPSRSSLATPDAMPPSTLFVRPLPVDAWALPLVSSERWADQGEAAQSPDSPVGPRGRSEAFATLTRVRPRAAHGTTARWNNGCSCDLCRQAHAVDQRIRGRARAQKRLPVELPQQLLDAIHSGQPFRTVLSDLGLTSNQVWGLTKTDEEWSEALEVALMAARRDDLEHGTNAAYVAGCVCRECREHQRLRMARNR